MTNSLADGDSKAFENMLNGEMIEFVKLWERCTSHVLLKIKMKVDITFTST